MGSFVLKTLEEVGTFYNGVTGKSKEDFVDGNAKFITYMNIFKNPSLRTDVEDTIRITEGECQNTIQYGDILFTTSSETPDECGMSSVLDIQTNEPLYLNSFCFGFRFNDLSNIIPGFYKHLFRSSRIRAQIAKTANGVTRFNVSKKLFAKIQIPIPPLPIQQRIVETLDKFTSLVSSLDSEIALRQKQYEYYRNKLLSFEEWEESVEWKKLGDFCSFQNGFAFKSNLFKDYGTPIVRITNITDNFIDLSDIKYFDKSDYRENLSPYKINRGEILVAMSGATTGKIGAFKSDEEVYINQRVGIFRPQLNVVSNEYLYYCLQIRVNEMYIMAGGGAQPNLSSRKLLETMFIPIVSKERQLSIVRTLDTFESLLTNLKKERELRQKQYEYYREKLLTFA